jgi:hypothetical protein
MREPLDDLDLSQAHKDQKNQISGGLFRQRSTGISDGLPQSMVILLTRNISFQFDAENCVAPMEIHVPNARKRNIGAISSSNELVLVDSVQVFRSDGVKYSI